MELRLTEEMLDDIAERYERDGYVVIRNVLNAKEMAPIHEQWQRLREPLRNGQTIDGIKRDYFYVHGKLPAPVGNVAQHPNILALGKKLLGPDIALYLNRINVKDKSYTDLIHLHQDMPYFHGGDSKINLFFAMQNTNVNNGAMVMVPGSHKLGRLDRNTIDISKYPDLQVTIPSLNAGDLVIANIYLWHSSVPNTQGTDRALLQMMLQKADDGSYYPPSQPEPQLLAGQWRTSTFIPWEMLPSDVSMTAKPAAQGNPAPPPMEAPQATAQMGAVLAVKEPQNKPSAPSTPAMVIPLASSPSPLVQRLRSHTPVWAKRAVLKLYPLVKKNTTVPRPSVLASAAAYPVPKILTSTTGPDNILPLPSHALNLPRELGHTARYLKQTKKTSVLIGARTPVDAKFLAAAAQYGLSVKGFLNTAFPGQPGLTKNQGRLLCQPEDLPNLSGIDAVIVPDTAEFGFAMRRCEQFLRPDILFLPAAREAIVPELVRNMPVGAWGERSAILSYLYVSGLRGNFAEFGTFWGHAFFSSYFELQHWLQGKFYAFDSFEGLSQPNARETDYTNGDFKKGAYGFNHASFRALSHILDLPQERIVTVPGFFDKTLTPSAAQAIELTPKSLSVCRIDCDLLEPTLSVLNFITPLLDDGALVYFDDWRLCRSDPNLGERGAVLRWLKANPSFELIDFPSSHWQHQWFIFHRSKPL